VKRYNKISAELVVAPREVLEVRPRSSAPPPIETSEHEQDEHDEDERWDNSPCTD
jgi:hypothetical protein